MRDALTVGWAARANHVRWTCVSYVPGCQGETDTAGATNLAWYNGTNDWVPPRPGEVPAGKREEE